MPNPADSNLVYGARAYNILQAPLFPALPLPSPPVLGPHSISAKYLSRHAPAPLVADPSPQLVQIHAGHIPDPTYTFALKVAQQNHQHYTSQPSQIFTVLLPSWPSVFRNGLAIEIYITSQRLWGGLVRDMLKDVGENVPLSLQRDHERHIHIVTPTNYRK